MKHAAVLILAILASLTGMKAGTFTQTIRGSVIDNESRCPLPGANVILAESYPVIGTITDPYGCFTLKNIPVGRHTLQVSYIGYENSLVPDIVTGSAKEVVLTIPMIESLQSINEVIIVPEKGRGRAKNEMAVVSARSVTVEETKRYPAAISDLGRMALVFPGVSIGNEDASNDKHISFFIVLSYL